MDRSEKAEMVMSIWQQFWKKQLCNKDKGNTKIVIVFCNRQINVGFTLDMEF